jgi:hypothetical protein
MFSNNNKAIVAEAKKILKECGHDVKTSHIYELLAKLSGEPNWNVANAKGTRFETALKTPASMKASDAASGIKLILMKAIQAIVGTKIEGGFDLAKYIERIQDGSWKNKVILGIPEGSVDPVVVDPCLTPGQLFVGGMGAGKSVAMKFSAFTHMMCNSENTIYILIDIEKGMSDFKSAFPFKENVVVALNTYKRFELAMELLAQEAELRKIEFKKVGANYLYEYEKIKKQQDPSYPGLARIMVCFEDFHALTSDRTPFYAEIDKPGSASNRLKMFLRTGRAYGFNIMASSQMANPKTIRPTLRPGLSSTMAFRLNNASDIETLGLGAAERIQTHERGRCLTEDGFMQFPYLSSELQERLLNKYMEPLKAVLLGPSVEDYHLAMNAED